MFDPRQGLVGEWIYSQVALHEKYGGVVPDLATREHLRHLTPLLERARAEVGFDRVERISVTQGPGLAACLAIGVAAAKALGLALRRPVVGVNHLRAHAWSTFISTHRESPAEFESRLRELLPHLGLIVSGGNTLLFSLGVDRQLRVISSTRDDAAGEALDKGAKLLGLGYPGGPAIEVLARGGRHDAYDFPRGIERRVDLDFSFSGLKTSLRYLLEKMTPEQVESRMSDLCASYQQAVIDALRRKTFAALDRSETPFRSIGLSGGVANNGALRAVFESASRRAGIPFLAALPKHTGDNAGMVAFNCWIESAAAGLDGGMGLQVEPSATLA